MRTIYKYPIPVRGSFKIEMSMDAVFRHVGSDPNGTICIWAEVETDGPKEGRRFYIVGTGREIPQDTIWRGTFVTPPFVWHLYEDDIANPFDSPEYQQFVEKATQHCHCTPEHSRPCDSVLAGGLCDDFHSDSD